MKLIDVDALMKHREMMYAIHYPDYGDELEVECNYPDYLMEVNDIYRFEEVDMNDVTIISMIASLKKRCAERQYKPFSNNEPCKGCPFYTIKAHTKEHCQLSALFGNLSSNPYAWDVNKINGILAEERGLKEIGDDGKW